MKPVLLYTAIWGVSTTVVLGLVVPAFLWANMPNAEVNHVERVMWGCCLIGTAFGAWIGWRRRTPRA
jgi:hypothetical protein